MTTTNRYDEIIVRNRSNRVRALAFGLVLAIVTAFAFAPPGRCPTVPDDWWADLEPRSRARPGP